MSAQSLDSLTFPLHGARLIEASAGTGKTYTLAALYLRLVLGHGRDTTAFERPLLPPEILVVTFTEAATRELRERIRDRLAQAARCFAGREAPDGHDDFLRGLLADYPADAWPACADQLDAAAQWMDEAAVYTIHGFSNRMLRQHAFDTGSLFDLELNQDEAGLLQEAVRDYWRSCCYPLDARAAAALTGLFKTPDALRDDVRPLLTKTEAWPSPDAADLGDILDPILDERTQRLAALKAQWQQWAPELLALFEAAWEQKRLGRKKPSTSAAITKWLWAIEAWAADPYAIVINGTTDTLFQRLTPHALREATSADVEEIAAHEALTALSELQAVEDNLPSYRAPVLIHAAHWVRARIDRAKREQAVIGFDDMLTRLRDALNGPNGERLARIIREQFPVALIDEFQDTDPVQYETFRRVYADQSGTGLFMIGDPKQAIYSFRGADIFTYLAARDATQGRQYTLPRNFRSASGMVDAVNHLFSRAEEQPGGAFRLDHRLPYHEVEANGRAEAFVVDDEPTAGLTLWHHTSDGDDPSISTDAYTDTMAARTASAIVDLLERGQQDRAGFRGPEGWQPLRPVDIAILVRTGKQARAVRQALHARAVRSVYLSDREDVFTTPEAADVERWLQACAEPESETCVRAALATATLGHSWAELDRLVTDEERWEDEIQRFLDYRRLWRRRGVLPMLRRLLHDFALPARLLADDDERRLTNLLHLAELLQTAAAEHEGEQALVRWLAEQRAGTGDDNGEAQILRLESDADLVRVVTIHKAKGLEYPLVFLPFVCDFRRVREDDLPLRYHDDQGHLRFSLEPDNAVVERADAERLAEDLRLLYVAVTRARHACWLGMAPLRKGQGKNRTDLQHTAIGHLLTGGEAIEPVGVWQRMKDVTREDAGVRATTAPGGEPRPLPAVSERVEPLAPARAYRGPRPERWWIASYSALRPAEHAPAASEPQQAGDEIIADEVEAAAADRAHAPTSGVHGFVRGAMAGTFLHGLLEKAAQSGFGASADGALQSAIASRCRARGWSAWAGTVEQWLTDFLRTPLPFGDTTIQLYTLEAGRYRAELEFLLPAHRVDTAALDALVSAHVLPGEPRPTLDREMLNGMLKGFIDLVVESGGRYSIADYKSNWLGPDDSAYTAPAINSTILAKRQDVQYSLYLLALHRQLRARLGEAYAPQTHLGGAAVLFLRGLYAPSRGVHFQTADPALLTRLDALFAGTSDHAA